PKLFFPIVTTGTYAVHFLFSLCSLLLIGLALGFQWKLTLLLLPVVFAITCMLTLGTTLVFGIATVYFRDLTHILTVTLPAIFYTLPIFYPIEVIPQPYRQWFLLNPVYYLIDLYRQVICLGQLPPAQDWLVSLALAGGSLIAGLVML